MKRFLKNTITKSLFFLIVPTFYSVLFSYATSGSLESSEKNQYLFWAIFLFIVHIIVLICYGRVEDRQKKQLKEFENSKDRAPLELNNLSTLLHSFNKVILDNANELYNTVKKEKDHSDIADWSWMESKGDEICAAIYSFVKNIAERGQTFSVSMMFRKVENGVNGYTMMSRSSNDASHTPRSYRSLVPESEATGYYYRKIINENPTRPKILLSKREIKKHFANSDDMNYSQYIALPISCKGKTIGIIQIVAYNDSIISSSKHEVLRLCDNYFSIGTNIMLLTDKNENIRQII